MNGLHLAAFASLTTLIMLSPVKAQGVDLHLAHGESELIQQHFTNGETITASCSKHCLDLDLYLYDIDGNLLSQDTDLDIAPTLSAPYDGDFLLEVFMPNCEHPEGCTARIYSQQESLSSLPSQ